MDNSETALTTALLDERAPRRKWGGLVAAIGIWSFWAVLPASLLDDSGTRAAAAAQLGPSVVAYLHGAPSGLCWYLILGQYVALPALLALAAFVRRPTARAESFAQAVGQWAHALLPFLGGWSALFFAGEVGVAIADLRHGADLDVVRGYSPFLGWYGFLASLPLAGFVFACRIVIRRYWVSALASVVGSALVAMGTLVINARGSRFPTPGLLRGQLLSGLADQVTHAEWGCLLWGAGLVLLALSVLLLRSARGLSPAVRRASN